MILTLVMIPAIGVITVVTFTALFDRWVKRFMDDPRPRYVTKEDS